MAPAAATASPAKLTPRFRIPARDALVTFLFDDAHSDDPLLEHGSDWCAWDGGPLAPAEADESAGGEAGARAASRVHLALAPGASHVAAARGRRLAIVATVPHASPASSDDAPGARACLAEVLDAAGGDPDAPPAAPLAPPPRVTALCWIAFAVPPARGAGAPPPNPRAPPPVSDLAVVVGASDGWVRLYSPAGVLLAAERVDLAGGADGAPSAVRALHARDARRSPSRDDPAEDLLVVLESAAVRVDALELRSAARRGALLADERRRRMREECVEDDAEDAVRERSEAVLAALDAGARRARTGAGARTRGGRGDVSDEKSGRFGAARDRDDDIFSSGSLPGFTQGGVTRWDLSRLAPVADATCAGRLPPSLSRAGLARATFADDSRDAFLRSRGVGVLVAGVGDPRGDAGTVALLASYDDDAGDAASAALAAAASLARGAASATASAARAVFGGAMGLAGAVTKSLPVGRALGDSFVGAVSDAGNKALEGAGARARGAAAHGEAPLRSLTWRSALVDPPRRVRRLVPAPRGPLCAAADSLGRVTVLSAAAPASLTATRHIKGCRDAEVAWVEAPPPRGSHARVAEAAAAGLGPLRLAVRSPGRNGGAVELWDVAGCREKETGGDRAEGAEGAGGNGEGAGGNGEGAGGNGEGRRSPEADGFEASGGSRGAVRLLQAATPFGLAGAGASRATANAQAVAAARCFLLDAEGTLREVSARAR